ncbi:LexA family protein [Imhoffiella purpurea]|uniref:Error-prone repair protein UmuD n=1 Tax=Imhoffiella purpurea TaxID=1249627 RepID=W9VBH7_9GAMM|nr:translesion error-prone DNA polymerase V autoproteolytic subunit [Imhoffiella purpurea]EXJ16933.1 Error-prone repair protein UmuD [Imhoffiella purpurea]
MTDRRSKPRGGFRPGAGRKLGSGPYGEPTQAMRLPVSAVPAVRAWLAERTAPLLSEALAFTASPIPWPLPLYGSRISAGFPSPADDDIEATIDLNEHLVQHPAATFFVRVQGESMTGAGIHDGDLLVVDRALEPRSGAIVVAVVDGELTVKRLKIECERVWLMAENPAYPPLEIRDGQELFIWGVVAHAVRSF